MITGCLVRNTRCIAASTPKPSSANSGPRWSMVGISIARSTRSGTLVGPGIWRKCLPVCTVILRGPSRQSLLGAPDYHYSRALSPRQVGTCPSFYRVFIGSDAAVRAKESVSGIDPVAHQVPKRLQTIFPVDLFAFLVGPS